MSTCENQPGTTTKSRTLADNLIGNIPLRALRVARLWLSDHRRQYRTRDYWTFSTQRKVLDIAFTGVIVRRSAQGQEALPALFAIGARRWCAALLRDRQPFGVMSLIARLAPARAGTMAGALPIPIPRR